MPAEMDTSAHRSDQLVVDLGHLEFVQETLGDLGVQFAVPGPDDQDELLGLARLRDLTDDVGSGLEVTEVLALVRQRSAAQRDGFVPVMGKNRVVEAVIGEGHKPMGTAGGVAVSGHKPMYGADPEPVDSAALPDMSAVVADAGRGVSIGLVDTPPAPTRAGTPSEPLPYRAGLSEFVASLIRRQAPAVQIHVEGVLDPATGRADSWDTARAILRLASTRRLDMLNLSLGGYALNGPPLVMSRAVERLGSQILVIAAAGNHGAFVHLAAGRTRNSGCWPAAIPPTIAVGAVDSVGNPAQFSPDLPWVRCTTLGVDVVGSYLSGEVRTNTRTLRFDGFAQWSGTSFSAATVSGAVAARTVPGSVTPRQALADLLAKGTLVRPFRETA